jgi:hypothetical protein
MQDLIMIPGFELHQIKLKFNWPRFYFSTAFKNKVLEFGIQQDLHERINKIRRGYDNFNTAKLRVEANSPYNDGWTREHYEKEYKLNSRMDVIGQNGNEGTHYEEDWMDKEYKSGYQATVTSGMFWEWYPNLTGVLGEGQRGIRTRDETDRSKTKEISYDTNTTRESSRAVH